MVSRRQSVAVSAERFRRAAASLRNQAAKEGPRPCGRPGPDYRDSLAVVFHQDAGSQRGLSGSQECGESGDRYSTRRHGCPPIHEISSAGDARLKRCKRGRASVGGSGLSRPAQPESDVQSASVSYLAKSSNRSGQTA